MPKAVSAPEAIGFIEPGSRVFLGDGCSVPQLLVEALALDHLRLKGTLLITSLHGLAPCPYLEGEALDSFKFLTFIVSPRSQKAVAQGRADYIPCNLSHIPSLFSQGHIPIDVALVQVSPPDKRGHCSLGMSVGLALPAVQNARLIIAEVNEKVPFCLGEGILPISKIDYMVESSRPLLICQAQEPTEIDRAIASHVAPLIPHGATLQIGIGSLPESILKALGDKEDLGFHSGLLTDGVMDLMVKGALTNSLKSLDRGISVAGWLYGTERLFAFAHHNPLIQLKPASYTHDVRILSQIENFVSINSALEVDLTGQVNAESLGTIQVSGIGGQLDFIRGANLSKGGKAIIVLPSTAQGGKVSRIVPTLSQGTTVSTPRHDVRYIVTEHGVADLWGLPLKEREKALLSIAHPDFKEQLSAHC